MFYILVTISNPATTTELLLYWRVLVPSPISGSRETHCADDGVHQDWWRYDVSCLQQALGNKVSMCEDKQGRNRGALIVVFVSPCRLALRSIIVTWLPRTCDFISLIVLPTVLLRAIRTVASFTMPAVRATMCVLSRVQYSPRLRVTWTS